MNADDIEFARLLDEEFDDDVKDKQDDDLVTMLDAMFREDGTFGCSSSSSCYFDKESEHEKLRSLSRDDTIEGAQFRDVIAKTKVDASLFDDRMKMQFQSIREYNAQEMNSDTLRPTQLDVVMITIMCNLTVPSVDFRDTVLGFFNKRVEIATVMEKHGVEKNAYLIAPPANIRMELDDDTLRIGNIGGSIHRKKTGEYVKQGASSSSSTQTSFNNAVIFKYIDSKAGRNNKAIKIFCNGNLHITGCKEMKECLEVCEIVCRILEIVNGVEQGLYHLKGFTVQMINTSFKLNRMLDITVLRKIMIEEQLLDNVSYRPEDHAGLNVKFGTTDGNNRIRDVTILVFQSGEVIITGVVNPEEMLEAYKFIATLVKDNAARTVLSDSKVGEITERRKRTTKNVGKNDKNDKKRGRNHGGGGASSGAAGRMKVIQFRGFKMLK